MDNGSISADVVNNNGAVTTKVYTDDNAVFIQNGVITLNAIDCQGDIVTVNYNHNAYGIKANSGETANPIDYRNYYYDNETGFYYLKARYYDPTTGQFTQEDTVQDDNLQYNLYGYCSASPVLYIDLDGHKKKAKKNNTTKEFTYNRDNAFAYMKKYYKVEDKKTTIFSKKIVLSSSGNNTDYNYFYYDCTNFVSQCLHAGGLPMLKDWYSTYTWGGMMNGYSYKIYSYTKSWSVVQDNKKIVDKHFKSSKYECANVDDVKKYLGKISVGDVICFYDKQNKKFNHAAIISNVDYKIKMLSYAQHTNSYLYRSLNSERFKKYKVEIYRIKSKVKLNKNILK